MADVLTCILVVVLCGVFIAVVTVVSCVVAYALQRLADKVLDRWWRE